MTELGPDMKRTEKMLETVLVAAALYVASHAFIFTVNLCFLIVGKMVAFVIDRVVKAIIKAKAEHPLYAK